jgi:hypothetical protein
MPSLEGKRAMRLAQKTETAAIAPNEQAVTGSVDEPSAARRVRTLELNNARGLGGPDAQGEVWRNVDTVTSSLAASLNANVAADASPTSLQLALENEKLTKAQAAYVDALKPRGDGEADVIGLVVAVNGELRSADIYPSNGLFRKLWSKHLQAAATEAISKRDGAGAAAQPTKADVEAFLKDAEAGEKHEQALNDALNLEVSEGAKTEAFASRVKGGALLHMNLLKK